MELRFYFLGLSKNFMFICILFFSYIVQSQNNLSYKLNHSANEFNKIESPIQTTNYDIENWTYYLLDLNPSFKSILSEKYIFPKFEPTSLVSANIYYNDKKGDYLYYEGNKTIEKKIFASGDINIKNTGILSGYTSYSRTENHNTSWNIINKPEIYLPYLVTDTVGGGLIKLEDYNIHGNYAFKLKSNYLGVGIDYIGNTSYRLSDPRLSTYSSYIRLNLGASRIINNTLLSVSAYVQRHNQHISAKNFKNFSDKYFLFYGFGYWDRKESIGGNSYARKMSANGFNTSFSLSNITANKDWSYLCRLEYEMLNTNTEEATIKNIFSSSTSIIKPSLSIHKKIDKLSIDFIYSGINLIRNGEENIFENIIVDETFYNFKNVAKIKNYSFKKFNNKTIVKVHFEQSDKNTFSALTGIKHKYGIEKYKNPQNSIKTSNMYGNLGLGYSLQKQKLKLETNLILEKNIYSDNKYSVPKETNKADYQLSFIPFAYNSQNDIKYNLEINSSYKLNIGEIGIYAKASYTRGKRDKNANYEGEPEFKSAYLSENIHRARNEYVYTCLGLFFLF